MSWRQHPGLRFLGALLLWTVTVTQVRLFVGGLVQRSREVEAAQTHRMACEASHGWYGARGAEAPSCYRE